MNTDVTVLLVEDEEFTAKSIEAILRSTACRVVMAADGREALDLVLERETPFDLLLVDVQMPKMSGTELLSLLLERNLRFPTLVITGTYDSQPLKKLRKMGFTDILEKPFTRDQLLDAMASIIQRESQA